MSIFITTSPILNSNIADCGYYLRAQTQQNVLSFGHTLTGNNLVPPGLDIVNEIGAKPFARNLPLFIETNRIQFINGVPPIYDLPPNQIACVLPGDLPTDELLLEKIKQARQQGYYIALANLPENNLMDPCMNYVNYLFVNADHPQFSELMQAIPFYLPHLQLVINSVAKPEIFSRLCTELSCKAFFVGDFYLQASNSPTFFDSSMKDILHLLRQVSNMDFEFDVIVKAIERNNELAPTVMHFLNAVIYENKRICVNSIHQAVTLLGQLEVRRWSLISIALYLSKNRPPSLIRLALIRAQFAASLAAAFKLEKDVAGLFVCGLLSLFDVIMQCPMQDILWEVAVDPRIFNALIHKKGEFAPVIELVEAYGRADWNEVFRCMLKNNVDIEQVTTAYLYALTWFDQLVTAIT